MITTSISNTTSNIIGKILRNSILLSVFSDESMMLDVAFIYAIISFVAVIVLAQIYVGLHHERRTMRDYRTKKEGDSRESEERKESV